MAYAPINATLTVLDRRRGRKLIFFTAATVALTGPDRISVRYARPDERWSQVMNRHRSERVVVRGESRDITSKWNLLKRQMRNSRRYQIL